MPSHQTPRLSALCVVLAFTPVIFLLAFVEGMCGVLVGPMQMFLQPVSPEFVLGYHTERLIDWLMTF